MDRRRLWRGRLATALLFLLFGMALGAWTARVPAVKARLGLTDARLSLALLAFAVGCILGMLVLGRLVDRYGSTRVLVPVALAEGLLLIPPGYVPGLAGLAVALFAFGLGHGTLNIAMNANAIEVQRAWGTPLLSSFHAVYSIGGFLGALLGGLFAGAGRSAGVTFVAVGAAAVALAGWAVCWLLPPGTTTSATAAPAGPELVEAAASTETADAVAADDEAAEAEPARSARAGAPGSSPGSRSATSHAELGDSTRSRSESVALLLLGALALCALVGEGAAADWSAVYLRDSLGSGDGFAAWGYAAFAGAMTVGRLFGDRLTARFGPVWLVRGGATVAAAGLGAALLIDAPWAGVVGFGLLGAGLSGIAPQVFSAAGNRDPARAGRALSLVVSIGYVGFLLGPILIGAASSIVGLPGALTIPALLAIFVAASATVLRPPRPAQPAAARTGTIVTGDPPPVAGAAATSDPPVAGAAPVAAHPPAAGAVPAARDGRDVSRRRG